MFVPFSPEYSNDDSPKKVLHLKIGNRSNWNSLKSLYRRKELINLLKIRLTSVNWGAKSGGSGHRNAS